MPAMVPAAPGRGALVAVLLATLLAPLSSGCSPAMRGGLALAGGDHAQALARYHEALAQEPDSLPLRQRIGLTHFAMQDYAQAEASFQNILLLSPGEPGALFYLGLSRIGKGEAEAGLELLRQYRWPGKFLLQRAVQEEAQRLLRHPETPPAEAIRSLQAALDQGRGEQEQADRDLRFGLR